jgi:hypothetical protein
MQASAENLLLRPQASIPDLPPGREYPNGTWDEWVTLYLQHAATDLSELIDVMADLGLDCDSRLSIAPAWALSSRPGLPGFWLDQSGATDDTASRWLTTVRSLICDKASQAKISLPDAVLAWEGTAILLPGSATACKFGL